MDEHCCTDLLLSEACLRAAALNTIKGCTMKHHAFKSLPAILGIIILAAGCQATSGPRTVPNPSYSQGNRPPGTTMAEEPPTPSCGQACEKPPLSGHAARKYGVPPPLREVPAGMERLRPLRASARIEFDIDRKVFKAPQERFPGYALSDNADWSGCDHNHASIHVMGLSR